MSGGNRAGHTATGNELVSCRTIVTQLLVTPNLSTFDSLDYIDRWWRATLF